MSEKIDRRVLRTKEALHSALLALIMEKPYNKITVQDILDRANVGRATFYAHYQDKDELLIGGRLPTQMIRLIDPNEEVDGVLPNLLPLFEHIAENQPLLKALLGTGGAEFVIETASRDLYLGWLEWAQQQSTLDLPPEVAARFITGGLMELITWWLDEELPFSPQMMHTLFQKLMIHPKIPYSL